MPENFSEAIPSGAWRRRACGGDYCGVFRIGFCGRMIRRYSEKSLGCWAKFFGSSPANNDGDGKVSFKRTRNLSRWSFSVVFIRSHSCNYDFICILFRDL